MSTLAPAALCAVAALGVHLAAPLSSALLLALLAASAGALAARAVLLRSLVSASELDEAVAAAAEDRRRLREVAARAFRAQETERARIARELQDETAQALSGVLLQLRAVRSLADGPRRDALLDDARALLSRTVDAVRGYARGLHPPALADLGVAAAVASYAHALGDGAGVRVEVVGDDERGLSRDAELALYRIAQEALANAVRHGSPRRVRVEIATAGDAVRLTVADDGTGFDPAAAEAAAPCLGIFGMRERAAYAGGSVLVESAPGRGTVVTAEIPRPSVDATAKAWPAILPPAV